MKFSIFYKGQTFSVVRGYFVLIIKAITEESLMKYFLFCVCFSILNLAQAGVGGYYSPVEENIGFQFNCSRVTDKSCEMKMYLDDELVGEAKSKVIEGLDEHWVEIAIPKDKFKISDLQNIVVHINYDGDQQTVTNVSQIGIQH